MALQGGGGELSCAGKCYKNLLFAFNVLFLLGGITAICLGLFIVVFPVSQHIAVVLDNHLYKAAGYILILAGVAVVAVAFFGCCGAKYENKCLLAAYFCSLLGIFVIEFIAGILSLAFYSQAEVYIENFLEDSILYSYGTEGKEDLTDAWNYIQKWFHCCGLKGNTTDAAILYTNTIWYLTSDYRVPKSCCTKRAKVVVNKHLCQDRASNDWNTYVNNQGCWTAIYATALQYSSILAGMGIALSIIQLFGMALSFCLYRRLAPPVYR